VRITGLFLQLSLKRNGCGLLDLTVSGKKLCINTHDKKLIEEKVPPCLALHDKKTYSRKSSPLPCPLLKQRKKDRPQPCGIRDGKKSDPGSGINIPDPQHCLPLAKTEKKGSKGVTVSTYVMGTVRFKHLFLIIWPLSSSTVPLVPCHVWFVKKPRKFFFYLLFALRSVLPSCFLAA
jgi:hypothetical protein